LLLGREPYSVRNGRLDRLDVGVLISWGRNFRDRQTVRLNFSLGEWLTGFATSHCWCQILEECAVKTEAIMCHHRLSGGHEAAKSDSGGCWMTYLVVGTCYLTCVGVVRCVITRTCVVVDSFLNTAAASSCFLVHLFPSARTMFSYLTFLWSHSLSVLLLGP
jgi:hypothetical protein